MKKQLAILLVSTTLSNAQQPCTNCNGSWPITPCSTITTNSYSSANYYMTQRAIERSNHYNATVDAMVRENNRRMDYITRRILRGF